MTAKEFLSRYRELNAEINANLDEVEKIRALAERVTPSEQGGGSGVVSDRVGNGAARIVDLEREIGQKIDRLVDLREEIESVISKVENARYRVLLQSRYILGLSQEKTAEKMNVSVTSVKRMQKKALREVEKILLSG